MIPKIIHYCWFGGKPLPALARRCIESWRRFCPEWEIREWNETNFDFSGNRYTQQAYEHKKWAFVTDYVRIAVLARHGGVYLDTDVEIIRPLDPLLTHDGFCGVEGEVIATGLGVGATPNHPVILALEKHYETLEFLDANGNPNLTTCADVQAPVLAKLGFDHRRAGEIQCFNSMTAYPPEYFCPKSYQDGSLRLTENTYSIHHYSASWASPASRIGYHLRRLAGERVYALGRKLFKAEAIIWPLLLFTVIFLQNLRGILNGLGWNYAWLSGLLLLIVGGIYGYCMLLRRRPPREALYLMGGLAVAVATPGNFTILWALMLALLFSRLSLRRFAAFNVFSLLIQLALLMAALWSGELAGGYELVKKYEWRYFYDSGFSNTNMFSLFLYQTVAYGYVLIRKNDGLVASLMLLAFLCYICSGGRTYSCAIGIITIVHFLPGILRRFAARMLLPGGVALGGAAFALGYFGWNFDWLRAIINERVIFWHAYVNEGNTFREILFGRVVRELPESMPPLDSAYLSLYVAAGMFGVLLYIAMFATAIRRNGRTILALTPVFVSMLFAAFFESHLFGASMLAIFPLYFVFVAPKLCTRHGVAHETLF